MKKNSDDIDSVLIKKAKNGNKGAFNILVNKYYTRVYASLFSFTKSKEDSEDLAQQTFVKVWQQLHSFRGESAFFTWVYRIAINLAKNFVASSGYKKQKVNTSIDESEIEINSFEDLESIVIHNQSLRNINNYINKMPESLKTAFTLREVEGKSYEEISIITDTPIGTVRSRIFRARESIIEYMNTEIINNE
ncbi:MAG: sigma-70 family RNA polymerase sigma factor [Gammaproteobacteria bacterium TMED225]|nr:MAG: sigma-70 family RNA polymerase sigma factor [Gammaproteobacteria bacterium TMED225]|tara:strand:- start:397 stop:972 length:576 start_codon:yes stop_codon:yes gene_type:complete